jgi:hypothetical protein
LIHTLPNSRRFPISPAFAGSLLQTDAPRPMDVLFALSMTSSSSFHDRRGII